MVTKRYFKALVVPGLFVAGVLCGLAGRELVHALDRRIEQVSARTIRSIYAYAPTENRA